MVALGSAETTREPLLGVTGTFRLTMTVRVLVTYCVRGRLGALLVLPPPPLKFVRDAPPTMSCAQTLPATAMTASVKDAMNLGADKNLMAVRNLPCRTRKNGER